MAAALFLPAPAKVNLGLRVLGRRADGYHEIDTVFCALELCDDVFAARTDRDGQVELTLQTESSRGLSLPSGADNLVCRAARAFLDRSRVSGGVRFVVNKRIPAGGGLGGGSSDAAQALRLCQELWGDPLPAAELEDLGRSLGADVAFFLDGRTLLRGRGIGEILDPIGDPAPLWFLLMLPPFGTSTATVFENHASRLNGESDAHSMRRSEAQKLKGITSSALFPNDLETAAFDVCPELLRLRDRVIALGHPEVRLSGSGSTLFLVHDSEDHVRDAGSRLRRLASTHDLRLVETRSQRRARRPRPVEWPGKR